MDYRPPGSSLHVLLQARILEWVAIPFSRGTSSPRDCTQVSCIAGRFFGLRPQGNLCIYVRVYTYVCVCVCVCIKHNLFIHLSVAGYLACPHVFAPVNNATMRSWFSFFYVNTQKSVARSDGHCIFQFLRTLHIVIHNGCTSIRSLFLNTHASTSLFFKNDFHNKSEVISDCGFPLYFHYSYWY